LSGWKSKNVKFLLQLFDKFHNLPHYSNNMPQNKLPEKMPHTVTPETQKVLGGNSKLLEKWNSLTPLAQNEWICWCTFWKKQETLDKHLIRLEEDLLKGKRRPCCWQGCPHRPGHPKKVYTAGYKKP
jgi:hypothetical protein